MDIHSNLLFRNTSSRYWSVALLVAIGGSSVGCWQEIRYDPEQSVRVEQSSDQDPAIQKPSEKTAATKQVLVIEQVIEIKPATQGSPNDSPSAEELPGNTQVASSQVAKSPAEPSSPLPVTESDTANTRTANTPAASPQASEESHADSSLRRSAFFAWQLGSQWSMGAAIYVKGQPVERYQSFLEHAQSAAHSLDLEFNPLPYKVINDDSVATIVAYLLDDQGSRLAEVLERQHGLRHAALLELAIRSNLLLLIYSPHNMAKGKGRLSKEQFQTWLDRLVELASSSQLPESIGKPLLDQLRSLAPYADVKRAVFKLHKQVAAELKPVS